MIDKRVAIGALARNCEQNLPENIGRIEELRTQFADSYVVVYENDSTDNTLKILRDWETQSRNIYLISEHLEKENYQHDLHSKKYPEKSISRISKMVFLRNKLKSLIFQKGSPDIVIFIDIDILNFSVDGILKSITGAPSNWGGLVSNGRIGMEKNGLRKFVPLQYDNFAYCELSRDENQISPILFNEFINWFRAYRLNKSVQNYNYYPCKSAFGGVGIYKADLIKDQGYKVLATKSLSPYFACICEHIPFNSSIVSKGAAVYISRELKTTYYAYEVGRDINDFFWKYPSLYSFLSAVKRGVGKL